MAKQDFCQSMFVLTLIYSRKPLHNDANALDVEPNAF